MAAMTFDTAHRTAAIGREGEHSRIPPGVHFEPTPYTSERRVPIRANTANAHMAAIKHFCLCALMAMIAVGAVGGLIALKTAAYFWRFHN
jgi:hypothetical protein